MICPYCRANNIDSAKFCNSCGKVLNLADLGEKETIIEPKSKTDKKCPSCGVSNPITFKFCMNCGANLISSTTIDSPPIHQEVSPQPSGIRFITAKCPECGSSLQIEENRDMAFCTYCGAKVIIHNENEHITRNIDEAEIKRAEIEAKKLEAETAIKLKEMEAEAAANVNRKKTLLIAMAVLGGITVLCGIIGLATGKMIYGLIVEFSVMGLIGVFMAYMNVGKKSTPPDPNKTFLTSSVITLRTKNHEALEEELRGLGFHNIKSTPLGDLTTGLLNKPGQTASLSIDGKSGEQLVAGQEFSKHAQVTITYHSFR